LTFQDVAIPFEGFVLLFERANSVVTTSQRVVEVLLLGPQFGHLIIEFVDVVGEVSVCLFCERESSLRPAQAQLTGGEIGDEGSDFGFEFLYFGLVLWDRSLWLFGVWSSVGVGNCGGGV
jgi:hypothetical protein